MAIVTVPVYPVAGFPWASRAVTRTAGVMTDPAVVVVGSTENASRAAAAGVMSNGRLVAPLKPATLAASVYP